MVSNEMEYKSVQQKAILDELSLWLNKSESTIQSIIQSIFQPKMKGSHGLKSILDEGKTKQPCIHNRSRFQKD